MPELAIARLIGTVLAQLTVPNRFAFASHWFQTSYEGGTLAGGESGILRIGNSTPSFALRSTILRVRELEFFQWVMKSAARLAMSLECSAVPASSASIVHQVCTMLAPALQAGCYGIDKSPFDFQSASYGEHG